MPQPARKNHYRYCQVIVGTILTQTLSYTVMVPFKDRSHCLLLVAVLNSCFALIKYRRKQMSFSGIHQLLLKAVFSHNHPIIFIFLINTPKSDVLFLQLIHTNTANFPSLSIHNLFRWSFNSIAASRRFITSSINARSALLLIFLFISDIISIGIICYSLTRSDGIGQSGQLSVTVIAVCRLIAIGIRGRKIL